jgi:hypothetical protein
VRALQCEEFHYATHSASWRMHKKRGQNISLHSVKGVCIRHIFTILSLL